MNQNSLPRITRLLLSGCMAGLSWPVHAELDPHLAAASQPDVFMAQRQHLATRAQRSASSRTVGVLALDAPSSCATSALSLCYDYRTGHAVYKPARQLMPDIHGLQRESMSLKRSGIMLRYSFK